MTLESVINAHGVRGNGCLPHVRIVVVRRDSDMTANGWLQIGLFLLLVSSSRSQSASS